MSDNMSDIMKNFSSILNGKEIPNDVQDMLNSFINNSNKTTKPDSENSNTAPSQNQESTNNPFSNIDMATILKLQKIMNSMNNEKNNPRANFLRSLKPYLKPSRQEKIEQYIQLFNIEKVFELINFSGGDKKDDI